MKRIYFLCNGNSCRSQMAEGYAKALLPQDKYIVKSAGIEKHGLNPLAVEAMADDGIDISQQYSKTIDPEFFNSADLIVTLCGEAKDKCPVIPPQTRAVHWPLPDPAQAAGNHEEKMRVFREVRDEIKEKIANLIQQT